jgi:hypothetical protein
MIVPRYWAESRLRHRDRTRQVTIRRFGWSDASQADAETHAEARARAALDRVLAGEALPRREPKVPYNGAEGVPIREEIVDRQGDAIVTRNAYGARCLNVPDILFADVDFPDGPPARLACGVPLALLIGAIAAGIASGRAWVGVVLAIAAVFLGFGLATTLHRLAQALRGGPEAVARARIARFLESRPDWSLRLYRTPAGLRLLAMHRPFAPDDPEVAECFTALGVDPVYVVMCERQKCFRARVSAKPWRIGIDDHICPRRGAWPVAPHWEAPRAAWVARYEAAAQGHAACRFVETLGSLMTHSATRRVQAWHDALCRAESGLPIA